MNRMLCAAYLTLHLTACQRVTDSGDLRTNQIYLSFHAEDGAVSGSLHKGKEDSYTTLELSGDDSLTLLYAGIKVPMDSSQNSCGKLPCGPSASFLEQLPAEYQAGELVSLLLERGGDGARDAIDNQVRLPARPKDLRLDPPAPIQASRGATVLWDAARLGERTTIHLHGCNLQTMEIELPGNATSFRVEPGLFAHAITNELRLCSLYVEITRTLDGHVDSALGGGSFYATSKVSVSYDVQF